MCDFVECMVIINKYNEESNFRFVLLMGYIWCFFVYRWEYNVDILKIID